MRVVVLTSGRTGTASHHLPVLAASGSCEVVLVVHNQGIRTGQRKHYGRKLRKILRIGPLGALNGVRMRKWFRAGSETGLAGRDVEDVCRELGIPFRETPSINSEETRALFRGSGAELGISLGNSYIGPSVFNIPTYGMINIHHEVLPEYQNAQSIIWQLYNSSKETGYTIHQIDRKIDTGKILYQERIPILFRPTLPETVAITMAALLDASAQGLVQCIRNFAGLYRKARPQGHGRSYTTPTIRQYWRIKRNFRLAAAGSASRDPAAD